MTLTRKLELYTKKFQFHPFWTITDWAFSLRPLQRGGDEWGNRSYYLLVPLIGMLVWFPGKVDRSKWFLSGSSGGMLSYISPDYKHEAEIPFTALGSYPDDVELLEWVMEKDQTLEEEFVRQHAANITTLDFPMHKTLFSTEKT